jgi:hypothetical protein
MFKYKVDVFYPAIVHVGKCLGNVSQSGNFETENIVLFPADQKSP